jgi:hypothetical protein
VQLTNGLRDYSGDTFRVGEHVVGLSSRIPATIINDIIEGGGVTATPPSIMFVIDHSVSMMGDIRNNGGGIKLGNDSLGSRYEVTRDLLDTLYKSFPTARVGLVVFREVLYFDHRDTFDMFTKLPDAYIPYDSMATATTVVREALTNQSYFPLTPLNGPVGSFSRGIDALRSILQTQVITQREDGYTYRYTDLKYRPGFTTLGNTNINTAFDAARHAFSTSTTKPENQYIIFLSDGVPYPVRGEYGFARYLHGGKPAGAFSQGTATPTTFTVYFTDEDEAPELLQTMTTNVATNGYSSSNPASALWPLQTSYDALKALILKNVFEPIMLVSQATPKALTINGQKATNFDGEQFTFTEPFELAPTITEFSATIVYSYTQGPNSQPRDTSVTVKLYIQRTDSAGTTQNGINLDCWPAPALQLYWQGNPVSTIDETMGQLEVRLTRQEGLPRPVQVEVVSTASSPLDRETLALDSTAGSFRATFPRSIEQAVAVGDGTLQHALFDSVVVTYRNPQLPLDTMRRAWPFRLSRSIALRSATAFDKNGDGFIDSLALSIDGALDSANLSGFLNQLSFPSARQFVTDFSSATLQGNVIGLRAFERSNAQPRTSTDGRDTLRVAQGLLPGVGWVAPAAVQLIDSLAPVIVSASVISYGSVVANDTLVVDFSEPVVPILKSPSFEFFCGDSATTYTATLDLATARLTGSRFEASVLAISGCGVYIANGDSIRIDAAKVVSDTLGSYQTNPRNRRVALKLIPKRAPYELTVVAQNNPLNPQSALIPPHIVNIYAQQNIALPQAGMVIVAQPKTDKPLSAHFTLQGTLSIYDAVGNSIVNKKPMLYYGANPRQQQLLFVWDGRNDAGRTVATGTYVAAIVARDDVGEKLQQTIRLGVKR